MSVAKSISLSVVGFKTPSSNWIWDVPSISKIILLSVPKSILACDDPYPSAKDELYIEVIAVSAPPVNTAVPPTVIASASKVPSKYPFLNWRLAVPKSISSSATGANAPSINLIWSAP